MLNSTEFSNVRPFIETLKVVPAPLVEAMPKAPPALELPNPTVEFTCGNCGAVLLRADEEKVHRSLSFAAPAAHTIRPTSDLLFSFCLSPMFGQVNLGTG